MNGRGEVPKQVSIIFGAMADPIRRQLNRQGIRLPAARTGFYQRSANAIIQLSAGGLLTDAERHRVRRRLMHALEREITTWVSSQEGR